MIKGVNAPPAAKRSRIEPVSNHAHHEDDSGSEEVVDPPDVCPTNSNSQHAFIWY